MKDDLENSLEVARTCCKGLQLLLKHGFDVKHALDLKDQFMHQYLADHHDELYESVDKPNGTINFYLVEANEFYEYAKHKFNDAVKDMCFQYLCAREQLSSEILNQQGRNGTEGYRKAGCYDCNGHDKTCKTYMTAETLFGDN